MHIGAWFLDWSRGQREKSFSTEVTYEWARFRLILPGPQKKWIFENGFAKIAGEPIFYLVAAGEKTILYTFPGVSLVLGYCGRTGAEIPEGAIIRVTEFWGLSARYQVEFLQVE